MNYDGDVNFEIMNKNHPTFKFNGEEKIFLTEKNYEDYIEFLKEYEEKVLNIKWSWEE